MKTLVKSIIFIYLLPMAFGCSGSEDIPPVIEESRNLFFDNVTIDVKRNQTGPVSGTLKYTGSLLDTPLTVGYTVTYPNQGAAEEGIDFELPATSGSVVIPAGSNSVTAVLTQSILQNTEANDIRSVSFVLRAISGFVLGKTTGQEGSSVQVNIARDISAPDNPEGQIGAKKLAITNDGNTLKIPYFSNTTSIDDENTSVTRAVIALQGAKRNAGLYYQNMLIAAKIESTQLDTLLVVSPQFLIEDEINEFNLDNEHLYWSSAGWKIGFLSRDEDQNPRPSRVSSFTVIDSLMTRLVKNNPNLKTIVFSGHSAGGQFVNRYSAASPVPTIIESSGVTVRFIVNNPSSYVYMDNKRRVVGTTNFEVPETTCTTYNDYKYGLDDFPNHLEGIGVEQIRAQLPTREVVYLLGENDNNPQNSSLDTSCEAGLQGLHRIQRGMAYYDYLQFYYGSSIIDKHSLGTVPNVDHDHAGMFQSELGRFYTYRK